MMKLKIKTRISHLWYRLAIKYKKWEERNFIKSSSLMYWFALIAVAFAISGKVGRLVRPVWLGKFIVISVCVLLGMIVKLVGSWVIALLLRNGIDEFISTIMIVIATVSGAVYFAFRLEQKFTVIAGVVIGGLFILFLKCLWSLVVGRLRTVFNISVVLVGTGLIGIGMYLLNSKGFEDTYIKTYLQLETSGDLLTQAQKTSFKEATEGGPYTALSMVYDVADADLLSQTVNLTSYAQNSGLAGRLKEYYQGYGLDEVPIKGKIWYPREVKQCPTLFIIHGNHDYAEESYLGYEYLGQYLASYGYIMVSVDENACNMLTNENDARAILLLENIAVLKKYNEAPQNPLYQKIDMMNLALGGHSRGGEAVSIAYLFNEAEVNPNNGTMKLDYHFGIRSIIAIAPTVDQYKPVSKSVQLQDVNYLLIHGANDQDLYNFMGMKQYKNISFTGKGDYIKTALYCAGCNHGQFNSRWGLYDMEGLYSRVLNVKNLIPEEEQQTIAEIFIKVFLDCTLKQDTTYMELLEDCRVYEECLPKTLYVQSYQKSDERVLCDFEEDTSLVSGTKEGVTLDVEGGNIWTEGLFPIGIYGSNSAVYLKWENQNPPTFIVNLPAADMMHRNLKFDVMNLRENFKVEEASLLNAQIMIEDASGEEGAVWLGDYATIYPAFLVRLNKLQYLLGKTEYKHQFQTVTIPIESFTKENGELDCTQIIRIKMLFTDDTGQVAIDEVAY